MEMATGQPPWHTLNLRSPVALINWVKRTNGPPPLPDDLSKPLNNFLLRCFVRDPEKRATARQLLSDPFIVRRDHPDKDDAVGSPDSVSHIDNLSRTAAIARIRRASYSERSRPASDTSYATRASLLSCDGHKITARPGSPPLSGSESETSSPPSQQTPPSPPGPEVSGDQSPHVFAAGGTQGRSPRRRPRSLQAGASPLKVVTTGLIPSSASPNVTTPPTSRRSSGGARGGAASASASPNPFGGRRRSLDANSPESTRSPRAAETAAALAGCGDHPFRSDTPTAGDTGDGSGGGVAPKDDASSKEMQDGVNAAAASAVDDESSFAGPSPAPARSRRRSGRGGRPCQGSGELASEARAAGWQWNHC